ncbi:hypothetical protein [Roseovarius indicus]|uniref:Uncharacterized protein n=1 Tax=Roseovarius indicus TaxID=540747 RepID=A0A0T5P452_9RHOB|nr:hypothetical protein [Roseovarius indicus]KRS15662.1 hypothetical protein XM52_22755 [Roseovarius indicus]QEW27827.1 hypothetical protein RIdsm_03647 [Roseovarius indicus]SFE79758.1 hypothetical protein SAMN04488031_12241 [Roseovarius indicus]
MCVPALLAAIPALGGAGATAAGATAAAGATTLQTIGTIASVAGTLATGFAAYQQGEATADALERERNTKAILNSIEDQRVRKKFTRQIAAQRAELVARGVDLSSPSAVYLGQSAAKEMTFASQSVRQTGLAERAELTAQAQAARSRGRIGLLKGGLSAAGGLLDRAPDLWPELLA